LGLVKNLIGVGVTDAGDEGLVAKKILQLPRVAADPLREFRLPHRQRIRAELRPTRDGRQRTGGDPVNAAHLYRVEEAQFLAVLERDAEDGCGGNLLRPGGPLEATAEHRGDG